MIRSPYREGGKVRFLNERQRSFAADIQLDVVGLLSVSKFRRDSATTIDLPESWYYGATRRIHVGLDEFLLKDEVLQGLFFIAEPLARAAMNH